MKFVASFSDQRYSLEVISLWIIIILKNLNSHPWRTKISRTSIMKDYMKDSFCWRYKSLHTCRKSWGYLYFKWLKLKLQLPDWEFFFSKKSLQYPTCLPDSLLFQTLLLLIHLKSLPHSTHHSMQDFATHANRYMIFLWIYLFSVSSLS